MQNDLSQEGELWVGKCCILSLLLLDLAPIININEYTKNAISVHVGFGKVSAGRRQLENEASTATGKSSSDVGQRILMMPSNSSPP